MARLFGTDGIRGVANVDLKPTLAYALGRATAHRLAGRGGAIVVGQDTRRSGDMFVAAIAAGATSLGVDVHVVGVVPTPALAFLAGTGPVRGRDHGLRLAQPGRRQRAQGPRRATGSSSTTRSRTSSSSSSGGPRSSAASATPSSAGRIDAGALLDDYRDHRLGAGRRRSTAAGLRLVLDGANGSGGAAGPEILAATGRHGRGHPRRAGRHQHQRPIAARPPRPRWPRRSSRAAPTSGSRSTATPTG